MMVRVWSPELRAQVLWSTDSYTCRGKKERPFGKNTIDTLTVSFKLGVSNLAWYTMKCLSGNWRMGG